MYENISRAKFEELNMDLFKKCMEPVDKGWLYCGGGEGYGLRFGCLWCRC